MPEHQSVSAYPTVSVIVLNYNSLAHLKANLDSLMALDYPQGRLEIVLADNASTDASLEWVARHYPEVRILQHGTNLGFAEGNTRAAQTVQSEWVAFLNPDTRVQPNWLQEMMRVGRSDEEVACVASTMLSWDGTTVDFADAAVNFMGWGCQPGFGSRQLDGFMRDKDLLFACGGAMLARRRAFLQAGGFDSRFFAYYEDVDLGWRLWLRGQRVRLAAQAITYHRHHGSWASVADAKRWMLAERNTLFTIIKNYDEPALARALPAALLLLLERAYLDIRPDPAIFGTAPSRGTAVFGTRYYLTQVQQLLQAGDFGQLWRRSGEELSRRWRDRGPRAPGPASGSAARPSHGHFAVPSTALSRLVAAHQVLQAWDDLERERKTVQAGRQRRDDEVFPLFQWALTSNFGDDQFMRAMQQVVARSGLTDVFAQVQPGPADDRLTQAGRAAALALLRVANQALALSGAAEECWQLDGPPPAETIQVPVESVAVLVEMDRLLWTLPQTTPIELLTWITTRCERVLQGRAGHEQ